MWPRTSVSKLLKIDLPLIQAPMAGNITSAELIANVSNAGGLGSLGAGYMTPENMRKAIADIRSLTDRPFAVNLFIPREPLVTTKQMNAMTSRLRKLYPALASVIKPVKPPYVPSFEEQLQVILEENIPVFSFTFGVLSAAWVKKLKHQQVRMIGTATSVAEARLLEKKGIDMVIAQGYEAGGHRGSFLTPGEQSLIGGMALIPQMADAVSVPVIAAGGIMDARGILAALLLGASGVQMGTAFITCPEAKAHPRYQQALLHAQDQDTVLTRVFSGKLARGLRNRFIQEMHEHEQEILDYPAQHALTKPLRDTAAKKNQLDYLSLWSGQASSLCRMERADRLVKSWDKAVRQMQKQLGRPD
ncbi:Nitronate monooxygenase [Aquicella siphonis]|uniref:Nitronate monooxygenase n=1 Tax=Aquicella siphonis TaxID=254247 RepID=A0A5E4PLE7_9COXI|nr:nitronate monooxygenase [Aquicella siphonis]VVC77207.1 Nitronate monooxygenase [Aquicella siphonis]